MSSTLNFDAIKQDLMLKTNYELIDVLSYSQKTYDPVIISVIKEILLQRGVNQEEIDSYDQQYQNLQQYSKSGVSNVQAANFGLRFGGFIIDIILLRVFWYVGLKLFSVETESSSYGITFLISLVYFSFSEGFFSKTIGMAVLV